MNQVEADVSLHLTGKYFCSTLASMLVILENTPVKRVTVELSERFLIGQHSIWKKADNQPVDYLC